MLKPLEGLQFNAETHRYIWRVQSLRHSVTNVLSYDMDKNAKLRIQQTKDQWEPRGNACHAFTEALLLNGSAEHSDDYLEWTRHIERCWLFQGCEILAVEYRLCDPLRLIGGSFDFLLRTHKGSVVLGDLKTVSSYNAADRRKPASAQLGAYTHFLAAHHPSITVDKCVTVVAGPGICRVISSEPQECVDQWNEAWNRYVAHQELLDVF